MKLNILFRKRFVFAIVCTMLALSGFGQNLTVESVEFVPMDLSASISNRTDNTGKRCGLIKVILPLEKVTFEGNIVGDIEYKSGEYWVFLSAGSRFLRVKHPQSKPLFIEFGNYDIKTISSGATYQVAIDCQDKQPSVDVVFKVYPQNAVLTIDQKEYPMVNGQVVVSLSPQEHNYTVVADGYRTFGNKFFVYPDQYNKIVIELESENGGNSSDTDFSKFAGNNSAVNRYGGSDFVETAAGLNMKMICVEGGEFLMGGTAEQGSDAASDEQAIRLVRLDSYYISECEVTQAQWEKVMGTSIQQQAKKADKSVSAGVGSDYPMYYVSWEEAQAFCTKLSQMTGCTYCLPTEAQWEYAARGGKMGDGTKFSGSLSIDAVAWYYGNSDSSIHPVRNKRANGLGLSDMSGSVWEWCSDWYGVYDVNDTDNPAGPSSGSHRVLRGGCWLSDARFCRVSCRDRKKPDSRKPNVGFRVVVIP